MSEILERVEKLEFVVAHLQSTLDDLNAVVIRMAKQLDRIERESKELARNQEGIRQTIDSNQTLPHERPPHY